MFKLIKNVLIILWLKFILTIDFSICDKWDDGKNYRKTEVDTHDNASVISIANGQIRGRKLATIGQQVEFYAFQGIPYAEPPVGDLRFAAPKKPTNWKGILNTIEDKSQCLQRSSPVVGSEDCLYMNVYTPSLSKKGYPVMVHIYGGKYAIGNSSYNIYGPDYLIEEEIVFVSFNYRIGVFGFISTEDLVCPGNWGLKDQVLALEWVHNNIKSFGGDPSKVTIFGESAGGFSVGYLLQIKSIQGLLKGAIMESGTSLTSRALSRRAKATAYLVGDKLKVNTANSTILISGLRKIDAIKLQSIGGFVGEDIYSSTSFQERVIAPVIEPDHQGAVLTNSSYHLLSNGMFNKIPVIIGFTSNEMKTRNELKDRFLKCKSKYGISPSDLTPVDLTKNLNKRAAAGALIKSFYFDSQPISNETLAIYKYLDDVLFYRSIRKSAILQSKHVSVYFYQFSFEGVLGVQLQKPANISGVGHVEELGYLFRSDFNKLTSSQSVPDLDKLTRRRLVKLWTNFAKFGNPTPYSDELFGNAIWAKTSGYDLVYLDIDKILQLHRNPFDKNMKFWDNIYENYGDHQYKTY